MKKYQIIYADPPWKYSSKELYGDKIMGYKNGQRKRFADLERKYSTMTVQEICDLNIDLFTNKDCACFLWVTDSHLKEGIKVLENWGFKYKTVAFVWLKKYNTGSRVYNFAPWTLKSTEFCLLGIKGKMSKYKKCNNVKQLVEAERTQHSKKPDEVRKKIELLFPNEIIKRCKYCNIPKQFWGEKECDNKYHKEYNKNLELFAREKTEGWDVWGNEVESDIIL